MSKMYKDMELAEFVDHASVDLHTALLEGGGKSFKSRLWAILNDARTHGHPPRPVLREDGTVDLTELSKKTRRDLLDMDLKKIPWTHCLRGYHRLADTLIETLRLEFPLTSLIAVFEPAEDDLALLDAYPLKGYHIQALAKVGTVPDLRPDLDYFLETV